MQEKGLEFLTWQVASKYQNTGQYSLSRHFLHIYGGYAAPVLAAGERYPLNTGVDDLKADLVCHCIVFAS